MCALPGASIRARPSTTARSSGSTLVLGPSGTHPLKVSGPTPRPWSRGSLTPEQRRLRPWAPWRSSTWKTLWRTTSAWSCSAPTRASSSRTMRTGGGRTASRGAVPEQAALPRALTAKLAAQAGPTRHGSPSRSMWPTLTPSCSNLSLARWTCAFFTAGARSSWLWCTSRPRSPTLVSWRCWKTRALAPGEPPQLEGARRTTRPRRGTRGAGSHSSWSS
mmetsp:Transcript_26736/g.77832  ORF Transcript_26736/g.77832 Transcript_26736/m.77832 type:complete len:219 (+) Transcript_26736:423-1079(+)